MKVLIAGASGLIGRALCQHLHLHGQTVIRLARRPPRDGESAVEWNPERGELDAEVLGGVHVVVCLSGENIGAGRWSRRKKAKIRESRVKTVALLSEKMASRKEPPATFITASAVGYYGVESGSERLTESSPNGSDFLAGVCKDWEEAARPAIEGGIRVVHLRFGVVLDPKGGALQKMSFPFRMGLGGVVGSGEQYFSWVTLDEVVRIVDFAIHHRELRGPVNAVAPGAVTNREFTKALGTALSRPTLFPLPAWVVRLVFGEMGQSLLLSGAQVYPQILEKAGYTFKHPDLESALRYALDR